jgi:hypothetical protein
MVIAALQSPSVGMAARLDPMHGQMKSQLQVSMYSPSICQLAIASSRVVGVAEILPETGQDYK